MRAPCGDLAGGESMRLPIVLFVSASISDGHADAAGVRRG